VETFKDRLKDLYEEKGLMIRKLAEQLEIGHSNIVRREHGKQEPTASSIIRLAVFFYVTAGYLLGFRKLI